MGGRHTGNKRFGASLSLCSPQKRHQASSDCREASGGLKREDEVGFLQHMRLVFATAQLSRLLSVVCAWVADRGPSAPVVGMKSSTRQQRDNARRGWVARTGWRSKGEREKTFFFSDSRQQERRGQEDVLAGSEC